MIHAKINQQQPVLYRHIDAVAMRNATEEELDQSIEAAETDGGQGLIEIHGVSCYVLE